jgi:putative transposase
MDETHLLAAVRYLAFNPVRARLCAEPGAWEWSSVRAHLKGRDDALATVRPILALAPRFRDLLELSLTDEADLAGFDSLGAAGRPLGDAAFLAAAERRLGRSLAKRRPGPKPKKATG